MDDDDGNNTKSSLLSIKYVDGSHFGLHGKVETKSPTRFHSKLYLNFMCLKEGTPCSKFIGEIRLFY